MRNLTVDDIDESDHFSISVDLDCKHQTDTESYHNTEYTRYILDADNSVHFLDVLNSAINRDKLNNGLYDALGNNNINKAAYIIVDVLQSATANKTANKTLPSAKGESQKCQMVAQ